MLTHSCRGREKEGGPGASAEGKGGPRSSLQFWLCPWDWGGLKTLASPASPALSPGSPPGSCVCPSASESVLISVPVSFSDSPSLPTPAPHAWIWGTAGMGQALKTEPSTVMGPTVRLWERHIPEKNRLRERETDMENPGRLGGKQRAQVRARRAPWQWQPLCLLLSVLCWRRCSARPARPSLPAAPPQVSPSSLPSAGPH